MVVNGFGIVFLLSGEAQRRLDGNVDSAYGNMLYDRLAQRRLISKQRRSIGMPLKLSAPASDGSWLSS